MPNQAKTKDPQAELIEALIEFQKTCPSIAKDKEGYGYKYTPLEKFLSVVNPALNKVGLAQSQSYDFAIAPDGENSKTIIVTTLFHKSGASITSRLPVREPLGKNAKKDIMHEWGGITTYSRRYALKMILGLEPDMDMNLEDVIERNEPVKKEIARSPQRGSNARQAKPNSAVKEIVGDLTGRSSIPQSQKDDLANELKTLPPHGRNRVISAFRQEYNISSEKISEFITTPEHLSFIKSKIAEVESDSP